MIKRNKEQAINKFIEIHGDIKGMIDKLQTFHENHLDVSSDEKVTWANVGDAQHIAKQLEEVLLSTNLLKIEKAKYNDEI